DVRVEQRALVAVRAENEWARRIVAGGEPVLDRRRQHDAVEVRQRVRRHLAVEEAAGQLIGDRWQRGCVEDLVVRLAAHARDRIGARAGAAELLAERDTIGLGLRARLLEARAGHRRAGGRARATL